MVRVTDVAESLGVKKPSVVVALRRLRDEGLVSQERYGYIELTPKGRELAEDVYFRHQVLLRFFRDFLGVSPEVAEKDACIMEHYLSEESLNKLREFMEKWEKR